MHPLYQEAIEVAERLKQARSQVIRLSSELAEAGYALTVAKARVERALIKKVGDERKLAPSAESRERIFTLARDADDDYLARAKAHAEAKARLDEAELEVTALREKLDIMLTAMKADEPGS